MLNNLPSQILKYNVKYNDINKKQFKSLKIYQPNLQTLEDEIKHR